MNTSKVNILREGRQSGQESEEPVTKKNQEQPEEMASDVLEQTATDQETDNEAATEAVNEQAAAEKLSAELEDLNQKFLRVAADFENYKRRTSAGTGRFA